MSNIDKLLEFVSKEVGYLEKATNNNLDDKNANAGYGNYTKYGRDLVKEIGSPFGNGCPWCLMFIEWCFLKVFGKNDAKKLLNGWSAYTPTASQYFKDLHRWYNSPQVGDIVFFKNSARICHVGIVTRVENNTLETIEGNTSPSFDTVVPNGGGVFKKSYSINNSRIAGYGRPKYEETSNNNPENVSPSKTTNDSYKCIDVSCYNNVYDYSALKRNGIDYAIIKIVNKSMKLDRLFETHLNGFRNADINIFSVYNYSYATTVDKAISDAKTVVNYMNKYKLKCKICMDVEDKCQKGLGAYLIEIINAYQKIIEDAGYEFILYSGQYFFNTYIIPYRNKLKCDFEWVARYYKGYKELDVSFEPNQDFKPDIGTEIEGWQYTSSCKVPGIYGLVDMNILYNIEEKDYDNNDKNKPNNININIHNVVSNCNKLNVRAKSNALPTTKKVGVLTCGDEVNIYKYENHFYQIGIERWVSSKYISCTKARVTASALNIRSGAGTQYNKIGLLKNGDIVNVLKEENGWYLIQIDNRSGYVSGRYLQERQ